MPKILIIEDEDNTRSIIVSVLADAGFECAEAENGLRGVEMAGQFIPDLIICDVQMPKLDGFGVFEQLAKNPVTANTPFIFLTGNTSPQDIRRGMNIGADDYLFKPFNIDDLLRSVQARLKKKENLEEKKRAELEHVKQELADRVNHDELTGLPNQRILAQKFEEMMAGNDPSQGIGIVVIGIDRLRNVNEAFGPSGGDHVIKQVLERIKKCLRQSDGLFRGESDAFVLLVPNLRTVEDADAIPRRILDAMGALVTYQAQDLHITVSIGCSFCEPGSLDLRSALNQAAMAVRSVRDNGGNGHQFYHGGMKKLALDRLTIESHLFKAKEKSEFHVYYQPKISVWSGQVTGMEALIRWQHPTIGLVPPMQFIPIAEENGLIVEIGEWILDAACRQTKTWLDEGLGPLKVAVNVSGRQLELTNFMEVVDRVLARTQLPPKALELEITESLLVKNPKAITELLKELKKREISIAIDDFGTGYSSLSYLREFPVDVLKLDRSFIWNIGASSSDSEIVSSVIKMGHNLKLKIVAEGVETESQLTYLRVWGCDEFQGYLMSQPLPETEFRSFLVRHKNSSEKD